METLSYLVMYTIHDDEVRNQFRQSLFDAFGINSSYMLNESSYKLPADIEKTVKQKLKTLVEKINKENICKDDFVELYCSSSLLDYKKEYKDQIIRIKIL